MSLSQENRILKTIINLQSEVIDQLFRELIKYRGCDDLPCIRLINEAAKLRESVKDGRQV